MSALMVNRVTGECHVTDDTTERVAMLVFDIDAVEKLENMVGKSAITLISGPPTMRELAAMLIVGVEGWNRRNGAGQKPLNPNLAKRLIVGSGGLGKIVDVVQLCLARAEGMGLLDGAEEEAQEAEADAARPTGTPPAS